MATTFVDYTGDGNATKSFSFPSIKEADIKVEVDNVVKTSGNHYNITSYTTTGGGNVVFTSGNIPASPAAIRIFRDTDVDSAKATFTAGSSVKAGDLNNNFTQILYAAQEEQNQTILSSDIKDGTILTADLADNSVTTAKIVDANVTTAKIADSNVTTAKIADSNITTAKIADSNVTTAKLAADAVTGAKIADDQINSEHYVDGSIDTAHIADAQITTAKIVDSNVTTAKIAADAVTTAKIVDDAVTTAKIAANAVGNGEINNNSITGVKIVDGAVTAAKIASNAVTTDKIADGELTTLAGMQSGTASKLADSTALTADIADLNQIDGLTKQTTISDSDASFPTSGAVVDYVAAQLEPFGGFEAIANEVSFPNTQPASGVAISIADAAGIVVNGSGVSTTGRTVGGSTVTINGINSQFNSSTVATGIRFIVTSTGSGQVYNYHKATLAESDLINLSGDINDFNERYRVGSSNPTSSLDNGDLFFNTSTGKLLVYNGTNSAWEEAQSIGNFFISTLSPAFDGTTQDFTLTNAPTNAQQVILSINGVVQKPNAGSSAPSEGFALSGSTVKLSAAPATGSTYHAVVMGSTVNIGTPSDNTVTTAILQSGSVTTAKIVDSNVTTAKIADSNVTTAKIADANVTTAKIADSAVGSAKIAVGGINTNNIADANVTTAKIADASITTSKIASQQVTGAKIANLQVGTPQLADAGVTTAKIANDAVTGDKIADDAINSEHYTDGSIDTAHIADSQITTAKIADEAVTLAKLEHGTSSNDGKFLRANNGADPTFETISTTPADGSITEAKLATGAVTNSKIGGGEITDAKIANNAIIAGKIATNAVEAAKIQNNAVTTDKIANEAITSAKIIGNSTDFDLDRKKVKLPQGFEKYNNYSGNTGYDISNTYYSNLDGMPYGPGYNWEQYSVQSMYVPQGSTIEVYRIANTPSGVFIVEMSKAQSQGGNAYGNSYNNGMEIVAFDQAHHGWSGGSTTTIASRGTLYGSYSTSSAYAIYCTGGTGGSYCRVTVIH